MDGVTCCYKCQDRYVGCHSKCEKYIKQKQEYEEQKERYRKEDSKLHGEIFLKDFIGSPPKRVGKHKVNINMSKRKYGN